ncbi:MAG: hypothetical protein AAGJ86_01095 [Pseudomonadota bacterium]
MQDDKGFGWPGENSSLDDTQETPSSPSNTDVFRNWLSRGPQPRRRASFDPSLYTWKGYRQWKDGVANQNNDGQD